MLRLPYLRITPAIAAVSSYTTCSVLSILSAVAMTSFASCQPQEVRICKIPSMQIIIRILGIGVCIASMCLCMVQSIMSFFYALAITQFTL